MISNILESVFCSWVSKVTKRGFTLAEALIITVMTGACLLPILGTMQNAQVRTENYDHQSKMQLYARSRLTAEIANAAFDHKSIDLEDEYHYIVYFASSTTNTPADEDEAKLIELPKTYATLEDMASLTIDPDHNNWATAAIELLGISRNNGAPYLKIVHAYKTSVESKINPGLAEYGNDTNVIDTPKALLGVVVKTCLIKSNDSFYDPADGALITSFDTDGSIKTTDKETTVLPVTLFSFVNLPTVSDEYIWMVASDSTVIGFDPFSKTVANTIAFEKGDHEPRHIAVHPSGKMLAVQCKKYIYLVNIDVKSPNKNEKIKLITSSTKLCEGPEEGGGITFRTDGKVLYYTSMDDKKLYMYELNYSLSDNSDRVLVWNNEETPTVSNYISIDFKNYGKKFTNLVAANDGYLYVGACLYGGNDDDLKAVYKYPMYAGFNERNTIKVIETEKEIRNIDVSSDNRFLLCVLKGGGDVEAKVYDTNTGNIIKTIQTDNKITQGIFVSFSGKELDFKDNSLFIALALTGQNKNDPSYIGIYNFLDSTTPWAKLTIDNFSETGSLIASPIDDKIVFTSILGTGAQSNKLLFFSNYIFKQMDYGLNLDESVSFGKKDALDIKRADLAAKKHDIMAVAKENRHIDIYDLNTMKELEDISFVATNSLTDLTMNNQGTMLYSSHSDNAEGCFKYNLSDNSTVNPTINTYRRKTVFDGNSQDMLFALQYTKDNSGNITNEGFVNIYYSTFDRWETIATDSYDRRNFKISPEWKSLDLIGMPNGGALVLYGKTDGSSMLEWIGRRNWAQDSTDKKGKYRLFARWTNIYRAPVTESYLPDYSSLTSFNLADSDEGIVNILNSPLNLNSEVRSFDFRAANGSNFNDSSTRYITPILLRKIASNKFNVVNYATNDISTTKGQSQVDVPITWKYEFKINQPETYYLGWWNGHDTTKYKGIIGYDSDSSTSGEILAGWAFVDRLSQLTSTEFETSSYPYKRNYNIKFKITPALSGSLAFPPLGSKKLAITPNQSIMAILATDSSDIPYINLYDFNNQLYGPETQIEGLLLDYRKQKQSGVNQGTTTDYTKLENPWPEENIDKPLFEKVEDNCHFGDGINTFGEATTKHDSWTSFNEHPCNYSSTYSENSSNKKGWANKRFIGYIRPETNIDYMQMYFSDEPRIFCNKSFIYGTLERGPLSFLSDALPLSFVSYSSNLFQLDYASNQGNMDLSVFFNTQKKQTMNSVTTTGTAESRYYYIVNNTDKTNGWIPLNSSDTYILNNHPSFMASFEAKINSSTKLDTTNTSMVFSRDRAKPVLYITGSTYLWALYKNSLIRAKQTDNGSIKGNLAISTNGQKLLYGTISGGKNVIRVVNIANPDGNKFSNTSITTKEESVSAFSDSYLNIVKDLPVDSAPSFLATKPFNSYSSEQAGGGYQLLIATTSFNVSTNAATVASGGIYIVASDSKKIAVYNPIINSGDFLSVDEVLKKDSNSAAVTSYDDTLYLFGNVGKGSDSLSGRVQSYNVNSKTAMTSLLDSGFTPKYPDEYQVNMALKDSAGSNFSNVNNIIIDNKTAVGDVSVDLLATYYPKARYVFFKNSDYYWRNDYRYDNNLYVGYKSNDPLTVNKICISNYKESSPLDSWDELGIKKYELYGANINSFSDEVKLATDTISSLDNSSYSNIYSKSFTNANSYKFFKLVPKSTFKGNIVTSSTAVGAKPAVVNMFQLWRTNVKRLTPPIGCLPNTPEYYHNNASDSLAWSNPNAHLNSIIKWSSHATNTGIVDFWVNGKEVLENNVLTKNSETWRPVATDTSPYILVSLSQPEALCAVRYSNHASNYSVNTLKVYGANTLGSMPGTDNWETTWNKLKFTNGNYTFNGPSAWATFITAEVDNNIKYTHYLVVVTYYNTYLTLGGFELFAKPVSGPEEPKADYLTPLRDDDLSEVKAGLSAACATPYGLVVTGGRNPGASGTNTCDHAMLYWPHAINKYDGSFTEFGIPRSLPNMNISRMQHSLVWHKGRIYAIGGKDSSNPRAGDSFAEYLDYNSSMVWQQINKEDFKPKGNDTVNLLARYNHGACSFGDEIFIFGGQNGESSKNLKTVYAWNPETGVVRSLKELPEFLSPCSAVVFGSKIYVMGMDGSSTSKFRIYEYTP